MPRAEHLNLPNEYGTPKELLEWETARAMLEAAPFYWIATVRADGRPHLVPRDGTWLDDRLWYGGSDDTVHNRIIAKRPDVSVSIGEGLQAVIIEGRAIHTRPHVDQAERLAVASFAKYPQYGETSAADYAGGVWTIVPKRVLAWTSFPTNCTRFHFDG